MTINTDSKILPYIIYFTSFGITTFIIQTIGFFGLFLTIAAIAFFYFYTPKGYPLSYHSQLNVIPAPNQQKLPSQNHLRLSTRNTQLATRVNK